MSSTEIFRIAVRKFDPFEVAIRTQWENFVHATGIQMEFEAVPFDLHDLYDTLFVQEGLTWGTWDAALLSTDWMATAAEQECLTDLAPKLKTDPPAGYPKAWTPSLLRMQTVGEHILGVPYHNGPECLFFRKDLFNDLAERRNYRERFGEPLRVPQTWEEFRQVASFFQRPERHLYGAAFAAFPDGHNTVYDFLLQLWTRGGELFDEDGGVRFATPEAEAALEFYRSMLTNGDTVHPNCREMDSVKSGVAFSAGEVALMVNWFGFATMAESVEWSQVKGLVDVAPVPFAGKGRPISLNSYWLLAIARGSSHQERAYEFLKFCMTPEMDQMLTLAGGTGCRRSTWSNPEITERIPVYRELEGLHAKARDLPSRTDWPEIASRIDDMMTQTINSDRPIWHILIEADARLLKPGPAQYSTR
jgi:multiple sugar transport system substrate-binding protein